MNVVVVVVMDDVDVVLVLSLIPRVFVSVEMFLVTVDDAIFGLLMTMTVIR